MFFDSQCGTAREPEGVMCNLKFIGITQEYIEKAAADANVHVFISELPNVCVIFLFLIF